MIKKLTIICCVLLTCWSCQQDDKRQEEIAAIPVELKLERFDERFASATADSLPNLKKDFPFLFPKQFADSVWIEKMNDSIQLELNAAVATKFPELTEVRSELHQLFQHIKYYFPQQEIPKVISLTSDVDYRNQVVWVDSLMLISLDTYLGQDHRLYEGVQEYIRKEMNEEQVVVDAAAAFAENKVPRPQSRSFLAHLVYFGKIQYLKEILVPFKTEAQQINYTPEELDWAKANEEQIWRYFVEKELLYSSDAELQPRFLFPAPFSKFYLELDNEAPARLGQYVGWQIVKQYMKKNEVSIEEMLQTEAEVIFNKSNYKPKK